MNAGPVYSGVEWLDRFMEAQAKLQAEQFFLMFSVGKLAGAADYDREHAKEVLDVVLDVDVPDLLNAADHLAKVVRDIAANVARNAGIT